MKSCHRKYGRLWSTRVSVVATLLVAVAFLAPSVATAQTSKASKAPDASAGFKVTEVAPGVYLHRGRPETWNSENAGDLANIGFIVGNRCVAVVDTGSTLLVGKKLLAAIRKLTKAPVCYVINTHAHPDHVLGNAAFADSGARFVGHANLKRALQTKGPVYLNAVKRDLKSLADGTRLVFPDEIVSDRKTLDLGGRRLVVQAWPTAHTDADVTVFDEASETLWLGDLSFVEHLPALDGSINGWLETIAKLGQLSAKRAIPGHGPVSRDLWASIFNKQRDYLSQLRDSVRESIADGKTIEEAVETIKTGENDGWVLYEEFHARNVTAAFAELEWE